MPQSTITYNGYTFPLTRLSVVESPVYSGDGITLEGTAYSFTIDGLITADTQEDFAKVLNNMRCQLRTPRQALTITWQPTSGGPSTYWSFDPMASPDNAWGPHPGELRITKFSGGLAAIYGFSIAAFRKECFGGSCDAASRQSQVLSINKTYSFTVDPNGFTTMTLSGKLVCTSQGAPADQYRYVVEPNLLPNFKRETRRYEQSEDGRTLSFSITDVEQLYTLPSPISAGHAVFNVAVQGGLMVDLTLSGSFEAPKSVPKSTILNVIGVLATTKFQPSSQAIVPVWCSLTTDVYKNRIEFSLTFRQAGGVGTPNTSNVFAGFQGNLAQFVANPPNSNGVAYITGPYGGDATANSGALGAAPVTYDACTLTQSNTSAMQVSGSPGAASPGGGLVEPPGTSSTSGVSSAQLNQPYLAYCEKYLFSYDSGIIFLYPKQSGAAPVPQQVRNPRLIVTQAGYMKKYVKATDPPPAPPKPFMESGSGNTDYTLMNSDIEPASAEPTGDGSWNLWTIHWRYILHYNSAVTNATGASMYYPGDPRRSSSDDVAFSSSNLPDVVTTPADFAG